MTIYGVDASDYDWSRGSFDVAAMARDGISFLTFKATEGGSIKHVHLADALNRGRAAGLPILGAYHVVRSAPSVAAQVAFYFAYLDAAVPWWRSWPGFLLQVDLEHWAYDQVTAATGKAFVTALKAAKPPSAFVVVYASRGQYGDTLAGLGAPLWNAAYPSSRSAPYRDLYPGDSGTGWTAYSGQTPMLWQYASTATIGGQPGCDINAFRGTLDQLRNLLGIPTTGGQLVATASDIITAWANGMPKTPDGTAVTPVTWRVRDEAWQAQINATIAAVKAAGEARDSATMAAINALAAVVAGGGGSIDAAAVIAAVHEAADAAAATAAELRTALDAAERREAELQAKLAAALGG